MSKTSKFALPSPFDTSTHKTERTGVAVLMHWMREIIAEKQLDLGMPDVETAGEDRKMPDMVLYESRRSQNVLCLIEAKPPYYDVFDEKELKEPAREKATQRKAKYFCTTNFRELIWFNTERVNAIRPEEEQIVARYQLSAIENLNDLEQPRYSEPIKRALADFLAKLYAVHAGREPEPKLAIDEFLIFRLQDKIGRLAGYYERVIDDQYHKDDAFRKRLQAWFADQGWSFSGQAEDCARAARQTAYLLVNKILFYDLLQAKRPQQLDPLEIPAGLTKGSVLQKTLQNYFDEVLKIDYETLYTADFIDTIAFPEAKEVVQEIKELVNLLRRYDFSQLGYDVLGRIFERLIPPEERHNLGQYFTNPDVVDLILRFCLLHEDDKVLDPACGAGTFLVRAYQHKRLMNQYLSHEDILATLWGNDIAKFPAHLATINLAINDLGVDRNYPNILQEDFFALRVGAEGFDPEKWRQGRARTLGLEEREVTYPRWFEAIVGNPPYTRQEEIAEIVPKDAEYKERLIQNALAANGKPLAQIGKRAGIHAYFFVHGYKFLREGGRFGFIVSNSWLDVDYGKGLQEFFLQHYKIVAIIESKVERWFEEADINTCIVLLQKCADERERAENLARFVYLKKPLRHFIPPAQDMWEKQLERLNAMDKLKRTILAHNAFYENDELRIYPKSQRELWAEGWDAEGQAYAGAKWGKYLRAPQIFFTILDRCRDKLVPLKEVAEVRFGIKTGANEFFYLTEEEIQRRGIEREFWMHQDERGEWVPNYVIKSPRECKSIAVRPEELKYRVLMIHKDREELRDTNVLRYIQEGERKGFHKRPTCASRGERWYDLGDRAPAPVNINYLIHDVARCFVGRFWVSDDFQELHTQKEDIALFLNCSLFWLFENLAGRTSFGGGLLKIQTYEFEKLLVCPASLHTARALDVSVALLSRRPDSVFDELGAHTPEEVSLDKVQPDRRELDAIIMGEILGLSEAEQLEVYRAVVDLVRSRLQRAKSLKGQRQDKGGADVYAIKENVIRRIKEGGP